MTIPDGIFKAYDGPGLYPEELDELGAERIGFALAQQLGARRLGVGMDPRPSSTSLLEAFAAGAAAAGAGTVDFGLVPTEMLYSGWPLATSTAAPWLPRRTTRRSTTG